MDADRSLFRVPLGFDGEAAPGDGALGLPPESVAIRSDGILVVRIVSDRRALPDLPVWLRAYPDGPWITTLRRTDREGWLRVGGLAPGPVQLEVAEPGWFAAPRRVRVIPVAELAASPPQVVRFARCGTVELRLRGLSHADRTAGRGRTRIGLSARGFGSLGGWLHRHLIESSTGDGRPDSRGTLRLVGVPATRLEWSVARDGIERRGAVAVTQHRVARIAVELGVASGRSGVRAPVQSGGRASDGPDRSCAEAERPRLDRAQGPVERRRRKRARRVRRGRHRCLVVGVSV